MRWVLESTLLALSPTIFYNFQKITVPPRVGIFSGRLNYFLIFFNLFLKKADNIGMSFKIYDQIED